MIELVCRGWWTALNLECSARCCCDWYRTKVDYQYRYHCSSYHYQSAPPFCPSRKHSKVICFRKNFLNTIWEQRWYIYCRYPKGYWLWSQMVVTSVTFFLTFGSSITIYFALFCRSKTSVWLLCSMMSSLFFETFNYVVEALSVLKNELLESF